MRLGQRALLVQADVTDAARRTDGRRVVNQLGRIDILVNNAGIMHVQPFAESTEESWKAEMDVNVFGPLRVTRAVCRT